MSGESLATSLPWLSPSDCQRWLVDVVRALKVETVNCVLPSSVLSGKEVCAWVHEYCKGTKANQPEDARISAE